MRILASDGMEKNAVAALRAQGHEVVEQFYEPAELAEQVKNFDVLVVRSATKVRVPIIDAACETGKLKLIIRGGVGIDNIDHKYAEEKGIKVMNTPRASSDAVAELAMAHMLSCARFISVAGHTMREGKWEKKAYKGIEIHGKTLGIVGFGRIGQALGRMAKGMGMNVIAFDIFHIPGIEEQTGINYVEMDELLAKSDFISVHAPAVDGGAIINAANIAKMKDGVVIINTSRGTNVDEAVRFMQQDLMFGQKNPARTRLFTAIPMSAAPPISVLPPPKLRSASVLKSLISSASSLRNCVTRNCRTCRLFAQHRADE